MFQPFCEQALHYLKQQRRTVYVYLTEIKVQHTSLFFNGTFM